MNYDQCPLCGRDDALGDEWPHRASGDTYRTCHGLNRPEHPGRKYSFRVEDGAPLHPSPVQATGPQAALRLGKALKFAIRDIPGEFLSRECLVSWTTHQEFSMAFPDQRAIFRWAWDWIHGGFVMTMLPIISGLDAVGVQFRAFDPRTGDTPIPKDSTRVLGRADGLYLPKFIGWGPSAIVIHEGPWGAIAQHWDGHEYGTHELFPVAVLSAGVAPETIRRTLDLIFPGVPRFSLFDQDYAGIKLREKTLDIATPITISGAGSGKDYRDLIPGYRFERLSEIIRAELKAMDGAR